MHHKQKACKDEVKSARKTYFNAINNAQREHWRKFLANATTNDIWSAARYAKGPKFDLLPATAKAISPEDINRDLLAHFFPANQAPFPSPPPLKDKFGPPLTTEEVSYVLSKSSNTSAPGPHTIPYSVWKRIHL